MSMAIDPLIRIKLDQFVSRRKRWTILYALMVAIVVWVVGVLLFACVDAVWILDRTTRSMLSLATYAAALVAAIAIIMRRMRGDDPMIQAAIAIERDRPELRDHLLSAVELARSEEGLVSQSFLGALQRSVSVKVRAVDIRSLLPLKLLSKPIAIAVFAILVCILLAFIPQLQFGNRFARAVIPGFDIDRVSKTRILIERPAPPSGPVPADEITAIVVRLEGALADKATLQWTADDGAHGKVEMHASDRNATDNVDQPQLAFAANVMVHQSPLSYRILAGDGVTRWQRLEPRARPEVTEFKSLVTPPAYTMLPSTTTVAADGNLKGMVGSEVSLRLRFNMPVKEVEMRRMNSDRRVSMRVDGDDWVVDTHINFADRYQVLARSIETGFDNPLSPQHKITPIEDTAPLATWNEKPSDEPSLKLRRELVTGFSKLNLSAAFSDEMPIDSVIQEVSVNDGEWTTQPLDGDLETAQIKRDWSWDLQQIRHKGQELAAGDVVQTRVVAVDRNGSRGESTIKEFIVSDHEFDSAKLERLQAWISLSSDVWQWKRAIETELVRLKIEDKREEKPNEPKAPESSIDKIKADRAARVELIGRMIDNAAHESEAGQLELLARVMRRVEDSLFLAAGLDQDKRREMRWIKGNAETASEFVRTETAHHLGMLLYDDINRMSASIQPTVRQQDPIDWTTFVRYFEITKEQYEELAQLIENSAIGIPDSTQQHNTNLLRWIDEEQRRLSDAISQQDNESLVRQMARHTVDDLQNHRQFNLLDGRTPSQQVEQLKRMLSAIGWTRDAIKKMTATVDELAKWNEKTKSDKSDDVREANEKITTAKSELAAQRTAIVGRLQHEGALHRRRPEADQKYVADTHLLERVLERIAEDDFKPAEGKSLRDVYQSVATAYHMLEAGHNNTQWGRELRSLADDDRWNANSAAGRIDAPARIERFNAGMEVASQVLEQTGLDWNEREPLQSMRWNAPMSAIYSDIGNRRWHKEDPVSVADKLDERCVAFNAAAEKLQPHLVTARKTLQALLPSIAELARKTAETLRESKVDDAAKADRKREEAEKKAEQLKENLADEANTQELVSDEGRRKARNADISLTAIEQTMEDVQEAADKAAKEAAAPAAQEAKQALDDATETAAKALDQIAQHYEQENADLSAEAKAALANTPSPLQSLEEQLGLTKRLDQQFARSDSIAKALNSDQMELLKKLQQELKRNPLMQKELGEIKDQTLEEAQRALAAQAARERELQMQLERSDPQLAMAKRELEEAIRRAAELGQEMERTLLTAAKQATDALRDLPAESKQRAADAKQQLQQTTQALQQAINEANQVGSADNQLMSDLKARADDMQASLNEASEALKQNNKPLAEILNDDNAKLDEKRRKEEQRQMENIQRRARDNQVQIAKDQQQRRAAQRQQQQEQEAKRAKARLQDNEDKLRKTNERAQREPDNQGLAAEVNRITNEVKKSKDALQASESGLESAKKAHEAAKQRIEKLSKTELPKLDRPQPAAQLAQSTQQQASEQLKEASEQLKAAAESAAASEALQPTNDMVAQATDAQKRVAEDVAETAEDLARAARHQQRLGQLERAQTTAAAAQAVKEVASNEVAKASQSLDAAKQSTQDPNADQAAQAQAAQAANEALSDSQAALQAQSEKLAATNQEQGDTPNTQAADGAAQPGAAESAQQMARTLDELDRSISAAQQANQQGQESDSASPSQSPATLSAAARRQAQKMAMNRSQKGESPSSPEGQNEPSSEATESGDGFSTSMADMFDIDAVERAGQSQWGKLRNLEAEDVAEERRVEISPEYRRQIEAYFRVIAEKGKE